MKTLCLDSSHKHLIIVLLEDNKVVRASVLDCFKRQSETLFPELMRLLDEQKWTSHDLDEVVITDGPGSYTGVRIAMTVAKIFCTTMLKPLYCLSTLQLYAGLKEKAFVMLDARSSRAYCALYDAGQLVGEENVLPLSDIQKMLEEHPDWNVITDGMIPDFMESKIDFAKHFEVLRKYARKIDNIHTLTPRYLKDSSSYAKK